ncbi:hypothetical protein VKT23_018665 [Stygiomarasmius scandens]|uniref:Uncharacterized protein n=1 Tax=Marasmiellus scandens TaxID=2682957 RepID=A0ABR1IQQ3_9AGAR
MRFTVITTAFLAAATAVLGVTAAPAPAAEANNTVATTAATANNFNVDTFEPHLIGSNFYGAPIPPWKVGYHPGWYYGNHFDIAKKFGFGFVFPYLKDAIACKLFDLIPFIFHCPGFKFPPFHPKPLPPHFPSHHGSGWEQVFGGFDGAIVGGNYLSYGLVDTIDGKST